MTDMQDMEDVELMIVRGRYSTIRSRHEDLLKQLQIAAGSLTGVTSQVLKNAQEDGAAVNALIDKARELIEAMQQITENVSHLAKQKAELRALAWPK